MSNPQTLSRDLGEVEMGMRKERGRGKRKRKSLGIGTLNNAR
jgi:hypothetical protein